MRRLRNVKIVATLGPASETYEMIETLHQAGADVFRLNMSHGSHEEIRKKHEIIREVEKATGGSIAILADLQGPKLRVGVFAGDSEHAHTQFWPLQISQNADGAAGCFFNFANDRVFLADFFVAAVAHIEPEHIRPRLVQRFDHVVSV